MADTAPLILFGGTFDPVHRAHISCARAVSKAFSGATVHLMPNAMPPHREQTSASNADRLAMLEIACAPFPELQVDDRELHRDGPSFTIDTLESARRARPDQTVVLVIGQDSLASFHKWHRWQDYPSLCHLAVLPRPGAGGPENSVAHAFAEATVEQLHRSAQGLRLMLSAPNLNVSATAVRAALAEKGDCPALAEPVKAYIRRHQLYNVART